MYGLVNRLLLGRNKFVSPEGVKVYSFGTDLGRSINQMLRLIQTTVMVEADLRNDKNELSSTDLSFSYRNILCYPLPHYVSTSPDGL